MANLKKQSLKTAKKQFLLKNRLPWHEMSAFIETGLSREVDFSNIRARDRARTSTRSLDN